MMSQEEGEGWRVSGWWFVFWNWLQVQPGVSHIVCVCLVCVPSSVSTYFNTLWPFLVFFPSPLVLSARSFLHWAFLGVSFPVPPVFPVEALSASFTTSSTYSQQTAAAYAARIVRLVCVLVGVSCQTPRVWNSKWKGLGWLTVKAKCAFIYLYLTSQVNNSLESGTEGGGGDGYKDEISVCVPVLEHYFHLFDFYGYSASLR